MHDCCDGNILEKGAMAPEGGSVGLGKNWKIAGVGGLMSIKKVQAAPAVRFVSVLAERLQK